MNIIKDNGDDDEYEYHAKITFHVIVIVNNIILMQIDFGSVGTSGYVIPLSHLPAIIRSCEIHRFNMLLDLPSSTRSQLDLISTDCVRENVARSPWSVGTIWWRVKGGRGSPWATLSAKRRTVGQSATKVRQMGFCQFFILNILYKFMKDNTLVLYVQSFLLK